MRDYNTQHLQESAASLTISATHVGKTCLDVVYRIFADALGGRP